MDEGQMTMGKPEKKPLIPMWLRWTVVVAGVVYFIIKYLILR